MCSFQKKNSLLSVSYMSWWIMNSNIHKLNYLVFENNPPVSTSLGLVQKKTIYTSAFVVPHIITLII